MAWSTPLTAVSGNVLTAAQWNASVRDNLAETSAGVVTTAGDITYADGANSMTRLAIGAANRHLVSTGSVPVWRALDAAATNAASTTASTTYTDLAAGANPSVTITTGTGALVVISCTAENANADNKCIMSYAISGATTLAASDQFGIGQQSDDATDSFHVSGAFIHATSLTAGSNVFTAKYRVGGGTGSFSDRRIGVIAF